MQRASRRAFLCAAAAAVIAAPAYAADGPAAQLIETASAEVIELIKSTQGPQREAGIRSVLERYFDLPYMGRAALATHWDATSAPQRERFLKAVISAEARAYSQRFGQYGGQTLAITRVSSRPNGTSVVDSKLNQSSGPPIVIQWEVRDSGQGLRITDVKIEGVSMVMTRRSDFNSYIANNGGKVDALIAELEARAGR
ncbi:MAG TPA: ABC transporter substrate-binding protein [Reyranella sp.]|nr:ABC transporter substrate-binding protein [Reyranella sp.]